MSQLANFKLTVKSHNAVKNSACLPSYVEINSNLYFNATLNSPSSVVALRKGDSCCYLKLCLTSTGSHFCVRVSPEMAISGRRPRQTRNKRYKFKITLLTQRGTQMHVILSG